MKKESQSIEQEASLPKEIQLTPISLEISPPEVKAPRNSFISKSRNELKRKINSVEPNKEILLPERPINRVKFQDPLTSTSNNDEIKPMNSLVHSSNNTQSTSYSNNYDNNNSNSCEYPSLDSTQHPSSSSSSTQQYNETSTIGNSFISPETIEDALQNMLMAWYHSGYATGRYQTLMEISQGTILQNNPNENKE